MLLRLTPAGEPRPGRPGALRTGVGELQSFCYEKDNNPLRHCSFP